MKSITSLTLTVVLFCIGLVGFAQNEYPASLIDEDAIKPGKKEFSPYANRGFPSNVYFGDTHLHTSLSVDAGIFGNRLGMEEAYEFCRGEEVIATSGYKARLSRPLDFVVIADHSDGMGFFTMLAEGDPVLMKAEEGRRWNKAINAGGQESVDAALEIINKFSQGELPWATNDPTLMRPMWDEVIKTTEKYNEPGKFTAFHGFEWTSLVKGNNLHRVVVFRDGISRAGQVLPYTLGDSPDPEELWKYLENYEEFIEDPYKMVDDIRGCGEHVFRNNSKPPCIGEKCTYCGINSICPSIQKINDNFIEAVKQWFILFFGLQ